MLGAFIQPLASGNYAALWKLGTETPTPSWKEVYVTARAATVLGKFREGLTFLENQKTILAEAPALEKFLRLQIDILGHEKNLSQLIKELLELNSELPQEPFFLAESRLYLGFAYMRIHRYGTAMGHFRKAVEGYELSKIEALKAHALLNLATCYKHLNYRTLFEETFEHLRILAERNNAVGIQTAYLKARANRSLDCEDFCSVKEDLLQLEKLCLESERTRDLASLRCTLAFALANLPEEKEELDNVIARAKKGLTEEQTDFLLFFNELTFLSNCGLLDESHIRNRFSKWNSLHAVYALRLYFVAAEGLARSQNYEWLWKISRKAASLTIKNELAPQLTDFRYFEALALLKKGETEKSSRIIHAYKSDAKQLGATAKILKIQKLEPLLDNTILNPRFYEKELDKVEIRLDTSRYILSANGVETDLKRSNLLYQFFLSLIQHPQGLTVSQLHEQAYSTGYIQERHEKRMFSLLERARKILANSNLIIKNDSVIKFDSRVKSEIKASSLRLKARDLRYTKIKQTILRAKSPVSISSLETLFPDTRRTLQLDLNYLIRSSQISFVGSTRNRKYFMGVQQ